MKLHWTVIIFFLMFLHRSHTSSGSSSTIKSSSMVTKNPKIAIIGAGIGGASAASYMTKLFTDNGLVPQIDVYEKLHVGGRLSLSELDGHLYEMGGSALHPKNKYMKQFVKDLGLSERHVFGIRLGLYDGQQYVLMDSDRSMSSFGKLFHRYGNSMSNWHNVIDNVLSRFLKVYEVQDSGYAFTSVDKLLEAIDPLMVNLTQTTAKDYLLSHDLLPVFVNEIVTGIIRIAYGQLPDVNAFVGTLSLAGAKAGLWGVLGGNEQVPQKLISKCQASLILRKVTKITLNQDGQTFSILSIPGSTIPPSNIRNKDKSVQLDTDVDKDTKNKTYDMVLIATPLNKELSGITLEGFPNDIASNSGGHYHQSVTTLVSGVLNMSYLAANRRESSLDEILTTTERALFNSLTRVYPVHLDEEINQTTSVWKVSSNRPLNNEELDMIFAERRTSTATHWLAYPYYKPPESLGPFVLFDGLFYTSSIDWAATSIEMSTISGRNAALLAFYHWTKQPNSVDSFPGFRDEL